MVEDRAGELFNVTPDRLESSEALDEPFEYLEANALTAHLLGELGDGISGRDDAALCDCDDRNGGVWGMGWQVV